MTLEQFTALLDRHGADRDTWPPHLRAEMARLLAASPEAAAALAQAARVQDVMRAGDPGRAVTAAAAVRLSNAVLARVPPRRTAPMPWWRAALERVGLALGAGREWGERLAAAAAAAAVLGVLAGGMLPTSDTQVPSAVELLAQSTNYLPLDLR